MTEIYVNPGIGSDDTAGNQFNPYKTIAHALTQAVSGSTIHLADGNYNATSGETFPLSIPAGVKVIGNEANKGSKILIEGSGNYLSRTFAGQNVTFVMGNNTQLLGVTVTSPGSRGTGAWVESTNPTIANCTFTQCKREGVFVTGEGNPIISGNIFRENAANGIAIAKNAKGQIQGNTCIKTGYGIAISDTASPTLTDNQISENRSGILISNQAHPILRRNTSERNAEDGLTVIGDALPDLGNVHDPGENIFRNNTKFDLQSVSSQKLVAVGNQIDPQRVTGNIEIVNSQTPIPAPIPTPIPIPNPQPIPIPSPFPVPIPIPNPQPIPIPVPIPDQTPTPIPIPIPIPVPAPLPIPIPDAPKPAPTPTPGNLTDIKGHWAAAFIQELVRQGILNGFPDRTFRPDTNMTRAQFAAVVTRAFNPPAKRPAIKFIDLSETFWAYSAIQQAYQGEFLSGFPNRTFRPTENLKRAQAIVSLVNGLGLVGGADTELNAYDDSAAIPKYAKDEIATATQKHMVVNFPKLRQLRPNSDATRAEIAAIVYQALVDAGRLAAIASPYIVT